MNAQEFFGNFKYLASAPNGVAKFREMILCLAVQGRLTKQNRNDIPASELLTEIESEKQRLASKKNRRITKPVIGVTSGERPYALPFGWEWVRFGSIAQHNSGKTLDKRRNIGTPRDYITTSNLYWGTFEIDNLRQMLIRDEELEKCTARKGDLLICEGGEAGRAAVWFHDDDIRFQNHIHRARFYCGLNPYYAYRFFEKINATGEINQYRKGVGISNMSGKALASIVFPLPPIEEQKRIVAKVDELMALCDKLEAQQQERGRRFPVLSRACHARFVKSPTQANLKAIFDETETVSSDDLRKSILSLAVKANLVAQDPKNGSADDLINAGHRLPANVKRRRKILKKATITFPPELFPDLPSSWVYASIQELYDLNIIIDYADGNHGSLYPRKSEFGESGSIFVTAKDISHGRVLWEKCAQLNDKKAATLSKGWAEGRDILLTHNATVGRVARVEASRARFLLGTSVTFYRMLSNVLEPDYFYYVLCSPVWQGQLEAIMEQTTRNQVSIQKQAFFRIPIAPLEEQRCIVARIDKLMALIDQLAEKKTKESKVAEDLSRAAVAAITGTQIEEQEIMKAPKTELVSRLQATSKPKAADQAPLAGLLAKHEGELPAKTLWQQSGLEIDAFYQQLKTEMANGWIVEPEKATMKELEAS